MSALPRARVAAVCPVFPTRSNPSRGAFLAATFREMQRQGDHVSVVAPGRNPFAPFLAHLLGAHYKMQDDVEVTRPLILGPPTRNWNGQGRANQRARTAYERAVARALAASQPVDWVYSHFLIGATAAVRPCSDLGLPCFAVLGESDLAAAIDWLGPDCARDCLAQLTGVVAVSDANAAEALRLQPAVEDKLVVLRNAVDHRVFEPKGRPASRARCGLSPQGRLVAFSGHFIERKGPLRLLRALEHVPGVKAVFLGTGPQTPRGPRVAGVHQVVHSEIPWWLSACDAYVQPSLAEGMSNATLEALACGLPVVVSDRPFNREFLTESCAAFVDPTDSTSIAQGIIQVLSREDRRAAMGADALRVAAGNTLESRVERLRTFVARGRRSGASSREY